MRHRLWQAKLFLPIEQTRRLQSSLAGTSQEKAKTESHAIYVVIQSLSWMSFYIKGRPLTTEY